VPAILRAAAHAQWIRDAEVPMNGDRAQVHYGRGRQKHVTSGPE